MPSFGLMGGGRACFSLFAVLIGCAAWGQVNAQQFQHPPMSNLGALPGCAGSCHVNGGFLIDPRTGTKAFLQPAQPPVQPIQPAQPVPTVQPAQPFQPAVTNQSQMVCSAVREQCGPLFCQKVATCCDAAQNCSTFNVGPPTAAQAQQQPQPAQPAQPVMPVQPLQPQVVQQAAPSIPAGSYLQSCRDVLLSKSGRGLFATCATANGASIHSALKQFADCASDIQNRNGYLQCNLRGGGSSAFWRYIDVYNDNGVFNIQSIELKDKAGNSNWETFSDGVVRPNDHATLFIDGRRPCLMRYKLTVGLLQKHKNDVDTCRVWKIRDNGSAATTIS